MRRHIQIQNLETKAKRKIVVSDIHGNLDGYKNLLKKVHYVPNEDCLILLGDLVEKGPKNLDTLHFIMNQVKNEDVHCIQGNCDFIVKNVLYSYRLSFLKHVLGFRKASLIHEMAKSLNLSINEKSNMSDICQILRQHYLKELSFLNDLPHILEDDKHIYVHAGLVSDENYGHDFSQVLTKQFFLYTDEHFHKTVIVGHMPVTEYCRHIASFDPIFDAKHNIYSIDGGNIVKEGGQLNALIFEKNQTKIVRYDALPEKKVIHDVPYHPQIPFFITWNHGEVQILEKQEKQSKVYSPYIHRTFWVENEFLTQEQGRVKATDYTNYEIPLKKGETVKIVFAYQDKVQIKKNGILGWTYKSNLE